MLARLIGVGRVGLGVVAVVSPPTAARLFALPRTDLNASAGFVTRLVGNRELALGAALLLAGDAELPLLLKTSAAVDAGDALVSLWSARSGLSTRAVLQSAVAGAVYAAAEIAALRRLPGSGDGFAAAT